MYKALALFLTRGAQKPGADRFLFGVSMDMVVFCAFCAGR
jgi:hypothetical protein